MGYAWDCADEQRMEHSYGCGKALFGTFFDVQRVSESLGYHGHGLASLASQVLGCPFAKPRSVTMSNWEAPRLTPAQVRYAALDALVTGQIFRSLRLWHHTSNHCSTCMIPLGKV